jgi:hypothetical protein
LAAKPGPLTRLGKTLGGISNVIKEFPFLAGFTLGRYAVEISNIQELPSILFAPAQNTGAL